MLSILINAYACSPIKGSEPGMAWNWIINLAQDCKLYVITEGEWEKEIEDYLEQHQLKDRIQFYYNPVSEEVQTMCWNQGDWRFYYHYRKWQKSTLNIAQEIIKKEKVDIIHQLNMVGYREPGLLWKINGIPKVWGPIGGFGGVPNNYLALYGKKEALKQSIKQFINMWQVQLPYIKKPIQQVNAIVACNSAAKEVLSAIVKRDIPIISEVGAKLFEDTLIQKDYSAKTLKVIWVGKNDERKALSIAIEVFKQLSDYNIELHVYGIDKKEIASIECSENVTFHGWLAHAEVQDALNNAHLLLFTSLFEATGTAVLEAISMGLPVLCHKTCGQGDIINDTCGFTVEMLGIAHSIQVFKEKIIELHNNRKLLKKLSEGAFDRVEEVSWQSNSSKMLEIYKSLV
ncbi:glycosyltransferase family 4 protein [Labilibacter marinus]|uniref:glycosyltransferase family 4 protein n=1 Tax=Labilibacter marinus TaxID=1477105 RepID=UPI0008307FCD|nr:glycosyltransferase family 4 protein [Labilibacter marinus]